MYLAPLEDIAEQKNIISLEEHSADGDNVLLKRNKYRDVYMLFMIYLGASRVEAG